jgi:DNA polymerase V
MKQEGMTAIVDCNSFYCACERLFTPSLLNKPIVVLSNNDGCIVSRTDEAKALGIGMAGPYYQNKEVIEKHNVAVFSSNYSLYGDLSMRVMDSLRAIAGRQNVEVYSVDEAFVNLHEVPDQQLNTIIQQLKEQTEQWTGIQVSVGVAPTKVLSKIANRLAKKNKEATKCIVVLDTELKIREALQRTPVSDIWGIGRRYAFTLKEVYNIQTAWELSKLSEEWGRKHLGGVAGVRLLKELKGFRCMELKDPLETKKMIATTRMFGKPVYALSDIKEAVATYTSRAAEKLRRQIGAARMIQVFLVSKDVPRTPNAYNPETRHRYTTLPIATSNTQELLQYALPLAEQLYRKGRHYIKAGVILSQIVPDTSIQGNLFAPLTENRQRLLMQTLDNINCSMRDDAIKYAATGLKRNWKMRQELRSKRYTTRWDELFEIH